MVWHAGSSEPEAAAVPATSLPFTFVPSRLQTFWVVPPTTRVELRSLVSPLSYNETIRIPITGLI